MRNDATDVWTPERRALWQRIEAHPFERADQALDFTERLARDRGWTREAARGAVAEYRRFCFLAMVSDTPVTPSEEVDEVWHQHLTYSRDYWDVWCGSVLGRRLHHDPTAGGAAEQARFCAQYAETLAFYEGFFGPPDPVFWPGTASRFRGRPRYRMVDTDRVLILPRPRLRGALALLGLAGLWPQPAQALPLNPLDWTAEPFLTLYAGLIGACVVLSVVLRFRMRGEGTFLRNQILDPISLAYLAGGYRRAADTVIIGLVQAGAATYGVGTGVVIVEDRDVPLPPELQPFRGAILGRNERDPLLKALVPRLEPMRDKLIRAGLSPSDERLFAMAVATAALYLSVIAFGIAKMIVGHGRGKPIGFLVFLTGIALALGVVTLLWRPTRTWAGDAVIAQSRIRHARSARAPRADRDDLLFAFALVGAIALIGTPFASYGHALRSSGNSSGCGGCGS
ncbi:TIGR04222 domain-containing membrane protein [Methylobacterium organophilum]|uniref:TIGR04222 domain-containing membrane protein n=1 Tax=Methylobacterium organophilum TaxID=410 RepID=A0ABQ4T268_METOR|nr:TIGR04222 domain-containing membrane protein [Methylobacterium organophilum]GJE25713.1 hypothetical protein LKMONMHP_0552 [Methylobacterium organophilum]